jgi:hypothetical protein
MASLIVEDADRPYLEESGACMWCGRPSTVLKNHKFTWQPQWVSSLALLGALFCIPLAAVVIIVGTKRSRLSVPLCDAHKNHWLWRQWLLPLAGFVGLLVSVVGTLLVAGMLQPNRRGNAADDLVGLVCGGGVILGLIWLVTMVFLQSMSIRAIDISDTAITLTNVSDRFIKSYRGPREAAPGVDDYVREHWGRGSKPLRGPEGQGRFRGPDDVVDLPPDAIQEGE